MKKLAAVNGKAMAITEVGLKLGLRIHPINLGNKSNGTTSYLVDKKVTHMEMVDSEVNMTT